MCGVYGLSWPSDRSLAVEVGEHDLRHRGPDDAGVFDGGWFSLGHTRLAILDLDQRSACPFAASDVVLVYNGELWNYRALRAELELAGRRFFTTGDTEVVAVALDAWGVDALRRFEGMFAVAWYDDREGAVFLARDRFGEVPLHLSPLGDAFEMPASRWANGWAWASEEKALAAVCRSVDCDPRVEWIGPGEAARIARDGTLDVERWYVPPILPSDVEREDAAVLVREALGRACAERAISDVPVCTLLSGGIDSTAVAWHLRDAIPDLVAFTAVLDPKGPDLRKARLAAEELGVELVEVAVPVPDADDLRAVVRAIEQPFKAQVEIGWACLCLAREMRDRGFKVVFSGEGSDELWASYGFTYHAMRRSDFDWHEYRRDLFLGQHRKNFARCNKVFMAHGVEARLPFLHTPLVELGLSLREHVVQDGRRADRPAGSGPAVPKAVMREAYRGLLPDPIVNRAKLAFQDGMGLKRAIAESIDDPASIYRQEHSLLLAD